MTEAKFQTELIKWAKQFGWRVHAERPARTVNGWRTAIQGDPGFCDLVLVKPPRLIFAELKVGKNKPTADQQAWFEMFKAVGAEAHTWRPVDWSEILVVLSGRLVNGA